MDITKVELKEWYDSLEYILEVDGKEKLESLLSNIKHYTNKLGVEALKHNNTPYINTLSQDGLKYPGDREIERKLKNIIRWNAMAMVVRANKNTNVGGHISTFASGATLLDGDLAEFYYNPGASLDFSDAANRAKFAVDGKPIFLETDGSGPTGSAPVLYLHQDAGEAPANFKDNKGTGGDYTITGTLTASPTSPTD